MNVTIKDPKWAQREFLSHSLLFSGLAPSRLDELVDAGSLLQLDARESLFRAGQPIREAHFLVSGTLTRSTVLAGQRKKVIELVQTQQFVSLGELFGASRYACSAETITPCIVVALEIWKLRAVIHEDLDLSWRIIEALAQRQCAIEFDLTDHHYGLTGTQRVLDYLIELVGGRPGLAGESIVTLNASKRIIASRIGMTPESFSRSLRQLIDNGVIVVNGRNLHIQNAALLNTEVGKANQRLHFFRRSPSAEAKPGKALPPGALINLCGRPRVLSQRMAMTWALIGQNITPAKSAVKLRQLNTQFEQTLDRLKSIGLPDPLADHLAAVIDVWPHYRQALFGGAPAITNAPLVLELSEEILEAIDHLAREAAKHAATPTAHYVNTAGRNRMLSQRIGKFFLFREWGVCSDAMRQRMGDSWCEFEINLAELKRSRMGVPELDAQLDEITEQWRKFESTVSPNLANANRSRHALAAVAQGERLLRYVDTAVKLYERLAR